MGLLVSFVLKMMGKAGKKVASELETISLNPREEQEKLLQKILLLAKDSEIAKQYDFASIDSIKTFQERLPIADYDTYSSQIERMVKGEQNVLTSQKVVHFNITSGTLGVPKKIPVIEEHVTNFSAINAKYLNYLAISAFGKDWTKGKGFSLSEGTYDILPTGVSIGCASSLHTARMSKSNSPIKMDPMAMMYTSPKEARMPKVTGEYTRYLHARFAMQEKNITYANATFSSYLLEIFRFIENNYDLLVDDIEKGTINEKFKMPDEVRQSILKQIKPMPKRAEELKAAVKDGFENSKVMSLIWPNFKYILCVGGASFQTYTDKILSRYVENVGIIYMGISSSEGMYSVPLEVNKPDSMLIPNATLMEFIPVNDGERIPNESIKLIDELEVGKQYELLISNVSGLFRYQLKDVIEVTGFHNKTPLVRFVNRAGFAINMYAEKTSEKALLKTAEETAKHFNLDLNDYCVVPYEDAKTGQYIFLFEFNKFNPSSVNKDDFRDFVEKELTKNNPVYYEAVEEGRLTPLAIKFLQPETFALYRDVMVFKGASSAQLKPVHVTRNPFQESFFLALCEE